MTTPTPLPSSLVASWRRALDPLARRLLRGRMIEEIVRSQAPNKVLMATSSPIDPAEQLLPFSYHRPLYQLCICCALPSGYVDCTPPGCSIPGRAPTVWWSASTADRLWLLSLLTLIPAVGRLLLGLQRVHIITPLIFTCCPELISPLRYRTTTTYRLLFVFCSDLITAHLIVSHFTQLKRQNIHC